jgi:predicted MPP superfamily phosphohydrolase
MRRFLLLIVLAGLALFAFGVYSAQQDPQVAAYRIAVPGLTRPVRIVQLSDSHASAIDMRPARLARVAAMINARKPDLILLTGDYISGNPDNWDAEQTRAAIAPFKVLQAPLGVFAVMGNHDDRFKTAAAMAAAHIRLLVGERVDIGPFLLVGADDISSGSPAVEAMRRAIRSAPPGKPIIVVAHEPVFFRWLQQRPVMMITGHTHGGQVLLPFVGPRFMDKFYADHPRGVYREGRHTLLVSSGLGTSFLPIRIGVPPEIAEITLVPGD